MSSSRHWAHGTYGRLPSVSSYLEDNFGWSLGWAQAGTLGFLLTTIFIAAMFLAFIFSFTELTTSIPHAGGPFAYAHHAFGETGGYLAGAATLIQYVLPPDDRACDWRIPFFPVQGARSENGSARCLCGVHAT